MRVLQDFLMFLGRVLFAFVFTYSAIDQLTHWGSVSSQLDARHVPLVPLVLGIGIFLQFFGGLSLFCGMRTILGTLALILYVVIGTFLMYDIATLYHPGYEADLVAVLQNTALLAGLLYVLANGPGRWSGDHIAGRMHHSALVQPRPPEQG